MPRRDLQQLSEDAYAWIFGISPALDEAAEARLLQRVDAFLDNWASHGRSIDSARDVIEGSFLLIAAENSTDRSGCSIDRLFGTLQQLERELGVSILDPSRVFFRHGDGRVDAMPRTEFRSKADPHTIVFDTTADTLGAIRSGSWERPAAESWHARLFA